MNMFAVEISIHARAFPYMPACSFLWCDCTNYASLRPAHHWLRSPKTIDKQRLIEGARPFMTHREWVTAHQFCATKLSGMDDSEELSD